MKYAAHLKKLFGNLQLRVEDLLLLESFQINYLQDRVPQKEFATVLRTYPFIPRFLISKNPSIENFIQNVLNENDIVKDKNVIEAYCDELIWEVADLIVTNKYPEVYDEKVEFTWELNEVIPEELLHGKIVADIGAGSGLLSFLLSAYVKTIFAIEPISSFRAYIREKATNKKCNNIYAIDGFLDAIPLPENSIDILFTSNAIGWNMEKELDEIERVVKPGGQAVHLMRAKDKKTENPYHDRLVSVEWNYDYFEYKNADGLKLKYSKIIK